MLFFKSLIKFLLFNHCELWAFLIKPVVLSVAPGWQIPTFKFVPLKSYVQRGATPRKNLSEEEVSASIEPQDLEIL